MSLFNITWSPMEYNQTAVIAQEAGEELLRRLDWMTIKPAVILDVGCGTGNLTQQLQQRYPDAKVMGSDNTEVMLQYAQAQSTAIQWLRAEAEKIPLPDQSVDLIVANLLLPWLTDMSKACREWRRLLRPDGVLIVTALGMDTLQEWRSQLTKEQIPLLVDMHDVGDLLVQEGFADPVLDVDYYTLTYSDVPKLQTELTQSGMLATGGQLTATNAEEYKVTYEIIHAHAFAPANALHAPAKDGEVTISLANMRKQLKG